MGAAGNKKPKGMKKKGSASYEKDENDVFKSNELFKKGNSNKKK